MINNIQQITINGQNSIFGGYIYGLRYNIAYGDSQNTVTISVVSEDGNYHISPANLQNTYCSPYTIQIGSKITFVGYLEDYNKRISPQGNTLTLKFVDTSHILDVIQVGLYKRHGMTSGGNLIIVGFELDPCNPSNYSNPQANFFDPCSPCINSQAQQDIKNYVDCEEKAKFEIHDIKYNFNELLSKIPIPIKNAFIPNQNYLQQYTGSLREVLNQWCQDFGFFFYWDNGTIVFKDLRNTIQVNTNISNFCPNILEYEEAYSMRNTVKTATVTNFARPGDPAKLYECQSAKYLELQSLLQNANYSLPLTITPKIDKIAAGLAYYSDDLRNLYYFYVKYQMYQDSNFKSGKVLDKLGMTILSNKITLKNHSSSTSYNSIDDVPLPSEIKNVPDNLGTLNPFSDEVSPYLSSKQQQNIQDIQGDEDFSNCVELLDVENQWKVINNPESFFFFLAEYNQVHHQKYTAEEREFAGFLNRYAIYVPDPNDPFFEDYDFKLDNLCGIDYFVNTGNVSYNFLGDNMGSIRFYNTSASSVAAGQGTPMSELPFAKFLSIIHDAGQQDSGNQLTNSGGFLPFKLIVAERGRNSFIPEGVTQTQNSSSVQDYYLLSNASKFLPYKLANKNNLRGDFIGRVLSKANIDSASNDGDIFLYLGCNVNGDAFKITEVNGFNNGATFGTLFDGKPLNKEQDPSLQFEKIIYQYPELQCQIIGNHSFNNRFALHANVVVFKTPIGQFKYTEPTDALFGIVIEKTKKTRRIIEKVESILASDMGGSCNFNKLKMNYRNISDDSLRVLTKQNNICQFDQKQIQQIHNQFSAGLALNYTQPTISKTFKVAGVDISNYTPTIDNGLLSLDISIDDKGVVSQYEFGTRLMILPSEQALNYSNFNMLVYHGNYTNTVNYFPLVGQPNL
jgi:hypothetical protein